MTSFDDLMKFSNSMSLIRPEDVDPVASAIWHSLIEDYYRGLNEKFNREYAENAEKLRGHGRHDDQPSLKGLSEEDMGVCSLTYGACE